MGPSPPMTAVGVGFLSLLLTLFDKGDFHWEVLLYPICILNRKSNLNDEASSKHFRPYEIHRKTDLFPAF
ncbi:hypothetical protein XENTR_v10018837 [Xenopus tropicalis]|nr:hypothetical protein XENTR_v10018837 [Xenopus tropicalis]